MNLGVLAGVITPPNFKIFFLSFVIKKKNSNAISSDRQQKTNLTILYLIRYSLQYFFSMSVLYALNSHY